MKNIISGMIIFAVVGLFLPGFSFAKDREYPGSAYVGTSYHYVSEINAVFKHSNCVDYGSRQIGLFAGKTFKKFWRMELELIIGHIIERDKIEKKDEILYGIQAGFLYDFARAGKYNFYTGLSFGTGYLPRPSGYEELGNKNPYGLFSGRLGMDYNLSKKYFLRSQVGIWHISSAPTSDQGQNNWDYSLQFGYRF